MTTRTFCHGFKCDCAQYVPGGPHISGTPSCAHCRHADGTHHKTKETPNG